ncbi:response regulator [Streptomyces sp. NPDC001889]
MPDDHDVHPPVPGAHRTVPPHAPPPRSPYPPPTRVRVVVADDNPVVRAGLTALLQGRAGLDVVAEAADGREACEVVARHRPDVVLLDVRMPGTDGLAALPSLVRLAPVLMMTYSRESEVVHEALRLGAGGYLVHGEFTAEQLVAAVRDIEAGGAPLSRSAEGALLAGVRGEPQGASVRRGEGSRTGFSALVKTSANAHTVPGTAAKDHYMTRTSPGLRPDSPLRECAQRSSLTQANVGHSSVGTRAADGLRGVITELSRREVEVMELIASGLTNQQIAAFCFISPKTVKNHINRIFAKLNAGSRGEAIAVWHGLARRGAGPS